MQWTFQSQIETRSGELASEMNGDAFAFLLDDS